MDGKSIFSAKKVQWNHILDGSAKNSMETAQNNEVM